MTLYYILMANMCDFTPNKLLKITIIITRSNNFQQQQCSSMAFQKIRKLGTRTEFTNHEINDSCPQGHLLFSKHCLCKKFRSFQLTSSAVNSLIFPIKQSIPSWPKNSSRFEEILGLHNLKIQCYEALN